MKREQLFFWSVVAIGFAILFLRGYYKDNQAAKKWHESGYYGMIEEIHYPHGDRGDPTILMNGNWKTIGIMKKRLETI